MATATKRKAKQGFFKTMKPKSCPDVDAAAEFYDEIKRDRSGMSKKEAEAKQSLIEVMLKRKLRSYKTPDGLIVTLLSKSNVVTSKEKTEEQESSNGEV